MAPVNDTFTAIGTSEPVAGTKISIKLGFAGAASIDIEEQIFDGSWIKIEAGITESAHRVFDSPTVSTVRLNCTAYTDDVAYSLETN